MAIAMTRGVVMGAVCLLLSVLAPPCVDAVCAWVSWISPVRVGQPVWQADAAHSTRADCERRLAEVIDDFNRRHPGTPLDIVCLPDTIDPRGPKGQ
jgi:hypothetical protein